MSKRAIAYARTSSDGQRDNTSIPDQFTRIRHYAETNDLHIVEEIADEAQTGQTTNRPGYLRMKQLARNKAVDAVIFYDVGRTGRRAAEILTMVPELEELGIEVHFVTMERRRTATGNFLLGMQAVAQQFYAEELGEKSKNGKLYKAARKKQVVGGNWIPYGYTYVKGSNEYTVNESEAAIINELFERYASGKESMNDIVDDLTRRGVPAPKGAIWHRSGIRRILLDTAYTGVTYFNKTRTERHPVSGKRIHVPRDKSEWIPIEIPPILSDPSLFYAVQPRFEHNRIMSLARNTTRHVYVLQGMAYCAVCGRRCYAHTRHGDTYYRCQSIMRQYHKGIPSRNCGAANIRGDQIEPLVWEQVKHLIMHPDLLLSYITQAPQPANDHAAKLAAIERDLAMAEHEEEKLLDLYLADRLRKEVLEKRAAALKTRIANLERDRDQLQAEQAAYAAKQQGIHHLHDRLERMQADIETYTPEQRHAALTFFDTRVWIRSVDRVARIEKLTMMGLPPFPW